MNETGALPDYNVENAKNSGKESVAMQIVLCILVIVMGMVVHKIYTSFFEVIHFSFRSVFSEWFWCIAIGGIIVGAVGNALGLL